MRDFYHGLEETAESSTLQNNREYKYNVFTYVTKEAFCF